MKIILTLVWERFKVAQWISTTKEDYYSKHASLVGEDSCSEWSSDRKSYTTFTKGVACLQMIKFYKRKVYYVNKSVFKEGE